MHALITIPAAARADANALALEHLDPEGGDQTFQVPIFPLASQPPVRPSGYMAAPEFHSEETLSLAQSLVAEVPGATIDLYELDDQPSLSTLLAGHGYRQMICHILPPD